MHGQPETTQVMEAAAFILAAASKHRGAPVYWFFLAAQVHAKNLICSLLPEQCLTILRDYEKHYPKKEWLPINKEIDQLLREKSRQDQPSASGAFGYQSENSGRIKIV